MGAVANPPAFGQATEWDPYLLNPFYSSLFGQSDGEAIPLEVVTIDDPLKPAGRWRNEGGGGAGAWEASDGTVIGQAHDGGWSFSKPISGTDGSFSGDVSVGNTLDVGGPTTLGDTLDVSGATTLDDTLDVSGATSLDATLDVAGAATLDDTLDVSGATSLDATLDVAGDTHIAANLFAVNGTFSAGVFGVNGTFSGTVTATLGALVGAAPRAGLGLVRGPSVLNVVGRNAANAADITLIGLNGADGLVIGTGALTLGFNGAIPIVKPTLPAPGADPLANAIRAALVAYGLAV